MKLLKLMLVISLAFLTGCSCTAKSVGSNIPLAGDESGPLKTIHFAFDAYELDTMAESKLDFNADFLTANQEYTATVEGHADERGTNEYNTALGLKRARVAHDYLVAQGVASSRLNVISYGEELPVDPGHNESAWSRNRRASFAVK